MPTTPMLPAIIERRAAKRAEVRLPAPVTPEINVEPEEMVIVGERVRIREVLIERFYIPRRRVA